MENIEIRNRAKVYGVAFWQIAAELHIGANTFSVWMREEIPDEKKKRVLEAIDAIIARREAP